MLHDDSTLTVSTGYRERVFAERARFLRRARGRRGAPARRARRPAGPQRRHRVRPRARVRPDPDYRRLPQGRAHPRLRRRCRRGSSRAAAGVRGVLTADDPVVYFTSSGSTGAQQEDPGHPRVHAHDLLPVLLRGVGAARRALPRGGRRAGRRCSTSSTTPCPRSATTASGRPHLGASQVDFGTAFGEPLSAEPGTPAPWATLPVPVVDPATTWRRPYLRLRRAVEGDVRCVIGINPAMVAALPYQLRPVVAAHRQGDPRRHARRPPVGSPDPARAGELERLADAVRRVLPAHVWPNLRVDVLLDHRPGLAVPAPAARGVRHRGERAARAGGRVGGPGRRSALDRHRTAGQPGR